MNAKKNVTGIFFFLITLFVLNVVNISLSQEKSSLTIGNKTESYLHISIDGNLYTYVAPSQYVNYETEPKPELFVQVSYSPGQGKTSSIIDSTFTIPFTPGSVTAYGDECSCQDPHSESSCSYTDRVVENPPQGGNARWDITDDYFLTD